VLVKEFFGLKEPIIQLSQCFIDKNKKNSSRYK